MRIGSIMAAAALAALVAAPSQAATLDLDISGMAFAAPSAQVHAGDVIVWSNRDFVDHTVTARDGSFDVTVPAGGTGRITLRHPGKTPFYCRFHPNMTGVLEVLP